MKTTIALEYTVHTLRIGGKAYPGMRLKGELGAIKWFANEKGEQVYVVDGPAMNSLSGFASAFNDLFNQQRKESDCLVICGSPEIMAVVNSIER